MGQFISVRCMGMAWGLICLVWAACAAADDADQVANPKGPPPTLATVAEVDKKTASITYEFTTWRQVTETTEQTVLQGGKPVARKVTTSAFVPEVRQVRFRLKEGAVFNLKGQMLRNADALVMLKPNSPVVVTSDERGLGKYYAKFFAPEVLVLVKDEGPAKSNGPAPLSPPPPPPPP